MLGNRYDNFALHQVLRMGHYVLCHYALIGIFVTSEFNVVKSFACTSAGI